MKSEISILHVSTPKSWRGGEQQLAYLFEELDKRGIDQHILCARGGELESRCEREGWSHSSAKVRSSINPLFAKKIRSLCKKRPFDLIHVHDSKAHTFAVMAAALFANPIPILVSRRVDFPVSSSPLSKWKYNHSKVARIICVSDTIAKITGTSIRDQSKLTTVHSGVDPARFERVKQTKPLFEELNLNPEIPVIGNVSALAPHKDYPTFIAAAKALTERDVDAQFVIVGDGPLRSEIHLRAERSGISDRIFFTGFRKDVLEVLSDFSVFLITSETEGLGTSILDAFGCGIPVVATRAGGIPELVVHEKTGLSAPAKDAKQLATEVERMLSDDNLRMQLVKNAKQHLQQFTKVTTAEKTLAVYKDVLTSSLS